ncbi:unnamed protein product [Cuscuta campestris]|uniref:Uncharacterized protein n=1 Tax=Cuscuta campestris TaxID=132261 RepID=A0A484NG69_9ASTE|nr:unnamed protein product [Cuscuta campestris]
MSDHTGSSGGRNRWSWEISGFEPRLSPSELDDHSNLRPSSLLVRRYSISPSSIASHSELSKHAQNSVLLKLKDKIKIKLFLNQKLEFVL